MTKLYREICVCKRFFFERKKIDSEQRAPRTNFCRVEKMDGFIGRHVKRLLRNEQGSTLPVPIYGVIEKKLLKSSKSPGCLWRVRYCEKDVDQYNLNEVEDLLESEVRGECPIIILASLTSNCCVRRC